MTDKLYMKCYKNTYETVKHSGWIKKAPLTIGKIYEILGETISWEEPAYIIKPDYKDSWTEIWAKSSGKPPEYAYSKMLFEVPTEEEVKVYLRDEKLKEILDERI